MEDRTRKITSSSEPYQRYVESLKRHGLTVVPVSGDGNCLFRSVAHQLYGDDSLHGLVREKCMDYMEARAPFFSLFVEGGLANFHQYLHMKRQLSCWGDDPEIQALCEIYGRRAHIWAFDPVLGARNLRTFHEHPAASARYLHGTVMPTMSLSFYGGGHYDSIVGSHSAAYLIRHPPGVVENEAIQRVLNNRIAGSGVAIGRGGAAGVASERDVDDTDSAVRKIELFSSDVEATDSAALALAISASRAELDAFGDEDVETCLALSLSSMERELTSGAAGRKASEPADNDISVKAEKKAGSFSENSAKFNLMDGLPCVADSKAVESHMDMDKAVLDAVIKESSNQVKNSSLGFPGDKQMEDMIIESQIMERIRNESLNESVSVGAAPSSLSCSILSPSPNRPSSSSTSGVREPLLASNLLAEQDQFALAIRQSEEEMLNEALRLSQQQVSTGIPGGLTEEEILQLVMLQSLTQQADSTNSSGRPASAATLSHYLNNNNNNRNISSGFGSDDDEDLQRALAASVNQC